MRTTGGQVQHTAMQLYLRAQEEVEAQSAHGEQLAADRSEVVVEVEVPLLGRS